ncbi:MAG: shikimate dehydrogenase [Actinomycetota bacterium]
MSHGRITASTTVAAVIGSPVRHSLSPVLQAAAFAQLDLDWTMVALEVGLGEGAAAVAAMRTLGLGGMAVTMPLKAEVALAVDELDPAAAALRSVNTVVRGADGRIRGMSTDGDGFVDSLLAAAVDPAGMAVLVLGAGGAARSIVDALGRRGAASVTVVNRSGAAAVEAAALSPVAVAAPSTDVVPVVDRVDLVVNTTPVGMGVDPSSGDAADHLPLPTEALRARHVVADIVYHPLRTPLLATAERAGATTVDGLGMLVHQAARQCEAWTGQRPDPALMRAAAEAELAARHR